MLYTACLEVIFSFSKSFNFFLKCLGRLGEKKPPFSPVIAQQETRNLLFNHLMTIPFLNLETHHSTLKGGCLLKKKKFPSETIKTSGLLAA